MSLEIRLRLIGEVFADFVKSERIVPSEARQLIPKVPSEIISAISNELEGQNVVLETDLAKLISKFENDFGEYGSNFRSGVNFAASVFQELNQRGFDFSTISRDTIEDFKRNYKRAMLSYASAFGLPVDSQNTRAGFLKGMFLFGFLDINWHSDENPGLMELFQAFGENKPFATAGSIMIYELTTYQYLKEKQS